MKKYSVLHYLFIILSFSIVLVSLNYATKTYANESITNTNLEYLNDEEKEILIEEAEFWGIPKELIRYMN